MRSIARSACCTRRDHFAERAAVNSQGNQGGREGAAAAAMGATTAGSHGTAMTGANEPAGSAGGDRPTTQPAHRAPGSADRRDASRHGEPRKELARA